MKVKSIGKFSLLFFLLSYLAVSASYAENSIIIDNKNVNLKYIDAAVNWGNGKAYFFKGNQYVRYDIGSDKADPGYPKPINSNNWPGLPWDQIDAVVNWGNGKAYFFKGKQYIRYDIKADKADPGYPQPIDSSTWPGLW